MRFAPDGELAASTDFDFSAPLGQEEMPKAYQAAEQYTCGRMIGAEVFIARGPEPGPNKS
jgi:hypothetical protein